ncbi:hypothetical protein SLS56_012067 [Neofusicoccum ribis]|uniref:Uncharacterized protein n=1 Tax=Neofusicoccum ribis TaxID=45134 RepID=A0ABR3S9V7_9PEZI
MERHDFTDPMSGNTGTYRALHVEANTAFIRIIPRFLMTWRDAEKRQQFLGDLSTDRNDTVECFLVLYLSVDQRQLLLYLHLPLKINTTPKGMKNTYMVIPTESFDVALSGSRTISHGLRETPGLDQKGIEVGTELIQARFKLKEQGFVAMSAGKTQKLISKRARGLLLSLKSLSQADSFDLFVRNSDLNKFVVDTFCDALRKGNTQTPIIDYKATFDGRPWGREAWKTYNLRKDDNLQEVWNPLRDENPPSYAQAVQSSSQAASALSNKLDEHNQPNSTSRLSTTQTTSISDTATPSESEIKTRDVEHLNDEIQHGRAESLELRDGRLEDDDGQSDSQETVRVQDDLQETRGQEVTAVGQGLCDGPRQDRPRKRNATEALLDTETNGGSRSAGTSPAVDREIRREATDVSIYVDDSQALDEQASSAQVSLEHEAARIILGRQYCFSPLSVFHNTGNNHYLFNEAQFRWFYDAALWLSTTWCNNHSVHSLYWDELEELCRAIRLQDRERYLKTRIRCMYSFTEEERSGEDEGPFAYELIERTRWMVDLINNELGLGHDSLIVDELTAMH